MLAAKEEEVLNGKLTSFVAAKKLLDAYSHLEIRFAANRQNKKTQNYDYSLKSAFFFIVCGG